MAPPQKRKRQQAEGPPRDGTPSKKTRSSGVYPKPSRTHSREARADNPHNQVLSEFPSENRKRQAPGEPLLDPTPPKKPRSSSTVHRPWNFSPKFYDNLSKIWPTPLALQELDRRNEHDPPPRPVAPPIRIRYLTRAVSRALARCARTGGPDLCDLRGYQGPTSITHAMASPSVSSPSSRRTRSTKPTTVSTKRSTAYDANFRQHCKDHHIYPPFYEFPDGRRPPKPANLDEIRQALKVPRGSLSPSVASETAFEDFQYKNTTRPEGTVMRNLIPLIAGDADIPNEGHLPFTNLASITKNTTVNPNPDFFDGAHPESVDQAVRKALDKIIIPTKKTDAPIAPNLFLEAKSSGGTLDVAEGQIILDGAHGIIIMHTLQNHLLEEPAYDGNAYTFTAIFLGGYLNLYAHYPTPPAKPGQNPGYHIIQLNAYALTGTHEGWLEGIGAFRNLRRLAQKYRDQFIEAANARARGRNTVAEGQQGEGSSPANFFDCLPFAESCDSDEETQETEEVKETQETQETQDTHVGHPILHHRYNEDDAEDPAFSQLETETSTGLGTSFASSITSELRRKGRMSPQRQPGLPRSPPSPLSPQRSKKKRGDGDR